MKAAAATLALVLGLLAGCAEGLLSSAQFRDSQSRVTLEYRLVGAHAFLAEFHRTVVVTFSDKRVEFPLEMDSGGYLLMNVYRLADGWLLLSDGEDHVVVDVDRQTVEQVGEAPAGSAEFLGCFDWPQGESLQFIPADRRPERRPLVRSAGAGK